MQGLPKNLIDLPEYRQRERVFEGRRDAGQVLARMLVDKVDPESVVLAIPAGGVPVACAVAEPLGLDVDVVVVSKITFTWNSEAGYGAVAQTGLVRLNERILARVRLSEEEIQEGIKSTTVKVNRRAGTLRGGKSAIDVADRPVILVDDGIASGTTMSVAIEAVAQMKAASITIATPTGHLESVRRICETVDAIFCANVRSGSMFAVASAYENWSDVSETEVIELLAGYD